MLLGGKVPPTKVSFNQVLSYEKIARFSENRFSGN